MGTVSTGPYGVHGLQITHVELTEIKLLPYCFPCMRTFVSEVHHGLASKQIPVT